MGVYIDRHLGQKLSLDIVTLAVETPPVILSNAIFAKIGYKQTYITSSGCVHRRLGQKLSLDIVTLAVETAPVIISNAIFSRITPII